VPDRAAHERVTPKYPPRDVADLPFPLPDPHAPRLRAAADVEGKIVRALDAIGSLAGRDVALLDVPVGPFCDRLAAAGIEGRHLPLTDPLAIDSADESLDAIVSLWTGFRGVDPAALREVDRVLRPQGQLLVVHDYGRDEVSELRGLDAPEYGAWSRRDGPFLRDGGFKIRVLHCFWTFESMEDAREFLSSAFGARGDAVGVRIKRPRLRWNVAVYHRHRGGTLAEPQPVDLAPG
jgi:SAM-dependent methyltransferase